MKAVDLGVARYYEIKATSDRSTLTPTQRLIESALDSVIPAIEQTQAKAAAGHSMQGVNKWGVPILSLQADKLAVIALCSMFNAADYGPPQATMAKVCLSIAQAVKTERTYAVIKKTAPDVVHWLVRRVRKVDSRAVGRAKKRAGLADLDWDLMVRAWVGYKLLEIVIEHTRLFEIGTVYDKGKTINVLQLTEEARDYLDRADERLDFLHPFYLPMVVPPKPWTDPMEGGYIYHKLCLIKKGERHLEDYRAAPMQPVYDAVNYLQGTEWRINRRVLEVMTTLYNGGGGVAGLPHRDPLPLPPQTDNLKHDPEALKEWKAQARIVHGENARMVSKRKAAVQKMWVANLLKDRKAIWFPHDLDWRGRMYPRPVALNPQSDDVGKGLLEFAEGVPLGPRGFWWLSIHIANCFGVDKVSFSDRYEWVNGIRAIDLERCAEDPYEHRFWTEADDPWQALGAIFEWAQARKMDDPSSFVSHTPVAMDGSCNGLQHFSAMGRDPVGGAAVNLLPGDRPADIYNDVSSIVIERVEREAAEGNEYAINWLGHVDRSTVKRSVMTVPYGVTKFGIKEQFITDGHVNDLEGKKHHNANYMRDLVYDAIGEVVVSARQLMDYLREVAVIAASKGLALRWHTPDGFLVIQEYLESRSRSIRTIMQDIYLREPNKDATVSAHRQERGAPPNFVHSIDGAHGRATLRDLKARAVPAVGYVHDSGKVHAAWVDVLHWSLRDQFIRIHKRNLIQEFKEEVEGQTGLTLPETPALGELDIECVRFSPYFFH